MNILAICPCCSDTLLHHFNNYREYWFCRNCWQEMPYLPRVKEEKYSQNPVRNQSIGLLEFKR